MNLVQGSKRLRDPKKSRHLGWYNRCTFIQLNIDNSYDDEQYSHINIVYYLNI